MTAALEHMNAAAQAVMAALASASAPLDVGTLAEAIGIDGGAVQQALDEVAGHGAAARRTPEGDWQVTCGLWAEAVLATAPSDEAKRALARSLLEALEGQPMGEAAIRLLMATDRPSDAVHEALLWARGVSFERALPVLEALTRGADALFLELDVHLRRTASRTLAEVCPSDERALAWLDRARERAAGPMVERVVGEQLALRRRLKQPWREEPELAMSAARSPMLLAQRSLGIGRTALESGLLTEAGEAAQRALQSARRGGDLERQAESRLADIGHLPWWSEECVARVRVLGIANARQPLPEPVRDWLGESTAHLMRLNYYLAVAHRDGGGAAAWDAMSELDQLLPGLSPDDRAAFQLMPWVARMTAVRAES